jgi:hypothetical protein
MNNEEKLDIKKSTISNSVEKQIKLSLDQCINKYAETILNASKIQKLRFNVKSFDLLNDIKFFKTVKYLEDAIKKINEISFEAFPDLNMNENEINTYNIGALSIHFFKLYDEIDSFNRYLNDNDKKNILMYMNKKIKFYLNIIALK